MYVLQCPEWVRLLYRKKEQVTRKSQVCDLKIRTLDDADENGYVTYPNVNTVTEMTNLIDSTRAYEANATAFEASKSMAQTGLSIGQ